MCSLLGFPNELLLLVYGGLGDLDDVFRLARCCRQLHTLFENNRISIMRSIIVGSDVYKYDIRLCHFIEANQGYYTNYAVNSNPPEECRPNISMFTKCSEASEDDLTNDQVWAIVCRWQGLRLLQDFYLHPSVRPSYLESQFPSEPWRHSRERVDVLASEGPIPIPDSSTAPTPAAPELQTSLRFNSQQTQRFYQALTAHWLSIESLRLTHISNYSTQTSNNDRYDTLHSMWSNSSDRKLRESCDVLEVYDFVQGYLVRKIFADVTDFPQWVLGEDTIFESRNERPQDNWDFFVKTVRLYLRPSDIIELFLMGPWRTNTNGPSSHPLDKVAYLRYRGFFDKSGNVAIRDSRYTPDPWFSVLHLETDVGLKLMAADKVLANVWAYFRNEWVTEGTRNSLWGAESDGDIVQWMRDFGGRRNCTSNNEAFPHISGESLGRDYVSPNAL